jgi:hypothetical protein
MRTERVVRPADGHAKDGGGCSSTCGSEGMRGRRDVEDSFFRRGEERVDGCSNESRGSRSSPWTELSQTKQPRGREEDDCVYEDQTSD